MNDKMKTPLWTEQNINIRPLDYSKENYLATFTPQTQLTPKTNIFGHKDVLDEYQSSQRASPSFKTIKAFTVKYDEIERKNLLIANDNLIADCLSKEVFYIATNSELTELLEYVIGTCLKDFNKRDKKHVATSLTRKKQVTFEDQCEMSNNNTHKHVEQLNIQKTNVPVIPSTGVVPNRPLLASGYDTLVLYGYGDYVIGDSVISRHSCYVRDTDGVELIKGSRGSNLYTISVEDMMKSSPICLLSKASKNKSWLWHRRLNHLNFGTINDLARKDLVKFLRSKDETPEFVINFLKQIQVGLNKTVRYIHIDNGTEFVNQVLTQYYESVGIFHQKSVLRTPQQNDIAEVVATACYSQNRSLIHTRHNKTPYDLMHDKKHDLTFSLVFGALCYPANDRLVPNLVPATPYVPPTNKELEILFQLMFDEYLEPPRLKRPVSPAPAVQVLVNSAEQGVAAGSTIIEDNTFASVDNNPFINVFALEPSFETSSSRDVSSEESTHVTQLHHHLGKWSKDLPLDNDIGNPS
ncbi:integrase, catalytic region, zinc finger, CCHC-type containing protein [Tanacetum coccineum]|uniref:Integrase, catalytic region, zinc finger, CCHC-type containing protein n=1 Tax=Tanacetum coccineum TaxID=301880 RepID=A0ABQ5DDC7_9ASTR